MLPLSQTLFVSALLLLLVGCSLARCLCFVYQLLPLVAVAPEHVTSALRHIHHSTLFAVTSRHRRVVGYSLRPTKLVHVEVYKTTHPSLSYRPVPTHTYCSNIDTLSDIVDIVGSKPYAVSCYSIDVGFIWLHHLRASEVVLLKIRNVVGPLNWIQSFTG